jgi:hypothetical protein
MGAYCGRFMRALLRLFFLLVIYLLNIPFEPAPELVKEFIEAGPLQVGLGQSRPEGGHKILVFGDVDLLKALKGIVNTTLKQGITVVFEEITESDDPTDQASASIVP